MPGTLTSSPPTSLPVEVAHMVGIWTEVLLYGAYTCLFFEAGYIMLRKRKENITSGRVFLITTFVMYILSTAHIALNLYRVLQAYVWQVELPAIYFVNPTRPETIVHVAMFCTMIWLGDGLVIYRCWVIWNYNYWVIALPVVLLILEFSFDTMLLVWFTHFDTTMYTTTLAWMEVLYPIILAQNVITTGLIAFKIWTRHRSSAVNGVVDTSSRLSLIQTLRIIIESAAVYTIQILIIMILYPMKHSAQFIIQSAIIPSIGIVFVLIAVRVHLTKSKTFFSNSISLGGMPSWSEHTTSSRAATSANAPSSRTMQLDGEKSGGVDLVPFSGTLSDQV